MICVLLMLCAHLGTSYPTPMQPCHIELTGGNIFIDAPFLPAAVAIKAAEKHDARVTRVDAGHWEWNYDTAKRELLPRAGEKGRPHVMHIACEALDANGRRAWFSEGGGDDMPAATMICALNTQFKNGKRRLRIALNADLSVVAAQQLWRPDEGVVSCGLPRKPPQSDNGPPQPLPPPEQPDSPVAPIPAL